MFLGVINGVECPNADSLRVALKKENVKAKKSTDDYSSGLIDIVELREKVLDGMIEDLGQINQDPMMTRMYVRL